MNAPVTPDGQGSPTRPYLIRALHEWCTDNGYTPYVAVHVDETVQVPAEYVKNGEIVLNVGFEATSALELGNEVISFRARFGGVARDIVVPVDRVVAIYARENGQGMAFPVPAPAPARSGAGAAPGTSAAPSAPASPSAASPLRLAKTSAPAPAAPDAASGSEGEPSAVPDAPPSDGATAPVPARARPGPVSASSTTPEAPPPGPQPSGPASGKRPSLTRIK
jgi:stringent starvation protein B